MPSSTEPPSEAAVSRRRIRTVARREFRATVSRPGFLVALVLMPVMLLVISMLPAIGLALSGGRELLGLRDPAELTLVGIVDLSEGGIIDQGWLLWHNEDQQRAAEEGRLQPPGGAPGLNLPAFLQDRLMAPQLDRGGYDEDNRIELRRIGSRQEAEDGVRSEELAVAWLLREDYLQSGRIDVILAKSSPLNPGIWPGRLALARLLRQSLAGPHIKDEQVLARLLSIMDPRQQLLDDSTDPSGAGDEGFQLLLSLVFASFFTLSIFVSSGYLLDGIGEEKENRVLELLLATVTPDELLLGKVLGLGAAGLLQTAAIAILGLGPMLALGVATLGIGTLLPMAICVVLGYAEYAALMAASGAVAGNRHEGRQVSAVFTLSAAVPMFVLPAFLAAPDGPLAVALSLFPLTAPIAMALRLGISTVPLWQVLLSFAGMAVTAWLSWRIGSRIFRVAILATGSRPSLRQILRWARSG